MKKVLILGVNGFIGHHLSNRILATTDWEVYGMDMSTDRITDLIGKPRFHFFEGDITINKEWVEYHVKKCDVILPLVAIATPATYVKQPLRVFELDFEANLPIVRASVKYGKHLVFPSTSEVYGMCHDEEFDPENSELICGPINKPRWIYSSSKQLMDRVIWGYGMQDNLNFTLFRPFNWIGAGLDSIHTPKEGSSRVVTQFLGHIVRGENISLVDGGHQKRAFTYIDDGIDALMKIIDNKNGIATGKIYNIGNPTNNYRDPRPGRHDAETGEGISRVPRFRCQGEDRRNDFCRLLRQGLSGRAEPRAEDHQHLRRTGLEADHQHGRHVAQVFSMRTADRSPKRAAWSINTGPWIPALTQHPSPASGRGAGGRGMTE